MAGKSRSYDDVNELKRCGCCHQWKPFSEFARANGAKQRKSGVSLQAYCRPCSLEKSNEWAANNKDAKREHRQRAYWNNPEIAREKARSLSAGRREKKNAKQREYRVSNMPKVLMWNRLRRHKERAAGVMPHRLEIGLLLCQQDAHCVYCGSLLSGEYHIDHKTPVSRGGMNEIGNLQILCPTCNMKKGAKTHEEYLAILHGMGTRAFAAHYGVDEDGLLADVRGTLQKPAKQNHNGQ